MTSSIARVDNPARESSKEQYAYSVNSSPSSRSSTSDDVFSNVDARSSQSSAPSSVKGSPLTYDSEAPSDTDSLTHQHELEKSLRRANISRPRDPSRAVAAELRRHPRRTSAKTDVADATPDAAGKKPVPTLIRQCDRKEQFVEALVDTTTEMIEVIWPLSVAQCGLPQGAKSILGLRKFVQEVLRRSKTSYSTLQVALFYLVLLIPFVPRSEAQERRDDPPVCRALRCGRRMFLAALILASKYLQDRNYTMLAWAKISGLKKEEICFNELAFLRTVNYDLHIPEQQFKDWADIVLKYSLEDECRRARALNGGRCEKWRAIVPHLTRDLFAVLNPECNAPAKQDAPMQGRQWTPPASPECWTAPSRSESPVGPSAFARPPLPRFLEPKAMTTVEMGLMSPRISKLETPCLPPINFDLTPAASTGRNLGAGSARPCAMGMALQQAGAASINRVSFESPVAISRAKTMPCSRRSYLSTSDSSSADTCDRASWGRRTVPAIGGLQTTPCAKREPFPQRPCAVNPSTGDDATHAARALQDISCASSAYPTPMSMDSMTDGSSVASDVDEISTPKAADSAYRPLVRNALKRERPISVCDTEFGIGTYLPQMSGLSNIIKHAGGIPVDYGSGVEDILGRSRHARSTSGSCDGARKRNRLDGAQIEAL